MSRPELQAPPEIFYNEVEAKKYAANTRMITIQTAMTERAIELLQLPKDQTCYLLDIGCGSGLSGEVLSQQGHIWVGTDISPAMLGVAVKREVEGDVICSDMGQGMFFRSGVFDGAISISALQWLCNADKREHIPQKRLKCFFQTLYNCLARGARAVFQFYPQNPDQMSMITEAAMRCGFSGGLVVDYPNSTKAKKYYLCLFAGEPNQHNDYKVPKGLDGTEMEGGDDEDEDDDDDEKKETRHTIEYTRTQRTKKDRRDRTRAPVKSREWVLKKKDRQRAQGKKTARDSKYAARRRPVAF